MTFRNHIKKKSCLRFKCCMCPHGGMTSGRPIDPPSLSLWHLLTSDYIYHSHIHHWHIRPLAKHLCHYFSRQIQREISVMREVRGILWFDWPPWEGFFLFFSFLFFSFLFFSFLFPRFVVQLYDLLYPFFSPAICTFIFFSYVFHNMCQSTYSHTHTHTSARWNSHRHMHGSALLFILFYSALSDHIFTQLR